MGGKPTDDPFLQRLQRAADAHKRIAKLMALYEKHPDTEEGKSAKAKADQLIAKYGQPSAALKVASFGNLMSNIKSAFPGKIDDSDLAKSTHRVVSKEEDNDDGEGY